MRPTLTSINCTVDDVDLPNGLATVKDTYGKKRTIRTDIRKGGGPYPRVGEIWTLRQEGGHWTFDTLFRGKPAVITGSGNVALQNLLSALEAMGFIDDQTTQPTFYLQQFSYNWKIVTDATDPLEGFIKGNNSNLSLITSFYVSVIDQIGTVALQLQDLGAGDPFWVYERGDIAQRAKYIVTGPSVVTGTAWASVPVALDQMTGFSPGNNTPIKLMIPIVEVTLSLP